MKQKLEKEQAIIEQIKQKVERSEDVAAVAILLELKEVRYLISQVEEIQKTLVEIANMRPSICTWSDEEYYENFSKCEEIAQQALQSLKGESK